MNKKEKLEFKRLFPLSNTPGSDMSDLNREYMKKFSENNDPLLEKEFSEILENHKTFLETGGAGGDWQIMNINSLIVGIYIEPNQTEGKQAVINFRTLKNLNLSKKELQWSNLIGINAEDQDFSLINLSNSLITDSNLSKSNFEGANLVKTDFSRSILQKCNFKGANLTGADFENCNLTGADFRGAILKGSRFPGAILNDIKY